MDDVSLLIQAVDRMAEAVEALVNSSNAQAEAIETQADRIGDLCAIQAELNQDLVSAFIAQQETDESDNEENDGSLD